MLSPASKHMSMALVLVIGAAYVATTQAQPATDFDDGVEVLARGPMHEAFAAPVVFDPEAGLIVPILPPEPIEELPPDERPDGYQVVWINGYWSWDDDTNSFIWVSGIWRDVPPDREWIPGYWRTLANGAQWVSGYWRLDDNEFIEYLPPPPASIEVGPSSEPPTVEHSWAPGSWVYRDARYVWRPGFWMTSEADWVWVPAQYVWTPRGCIFIDGYWDYAPVRRGVVFAPVRITRVVYTQPAYVYRPRYAVDVTIAVDHFFARPRCRHYYYGDYYARSYVEVGIYPSFAFHYSRYGYDPIYARQRTIQRRSNPQWEVSIRADYNRRRDNVGQRPASVYRRQSGTVAIVRPLREYERRRSGEVRFSKTSSEQIDRARRTNSELRDTRRLRATNERPEERFADGDRGDGRSRRASLPRSRSQNEGRASSDRARKSPERPRTPAADPKRKASPKRERPTPSERIRRPEGPGRRRSGERP